MALARGAARRGAARRRLVVAEARHVQRVGGGLAVHVELQEVAPAGLVRVRVGVRVRARVRV